MRDGKARKAGRRAHTWNQMIDASRRCEVPHERRRSRLSRESIASLWRRIDDPALLMLFAPSATDWRPPAFRRVTYL